MHEVLACVALGSNQGDREGHVRAAIEAMSKIPECRLDLCSQLYETPPWGLEEQPSFLNAACGLYCKTTPQDLLAALQSIETAQGRKRTVKWGPRTLDIDIICFDDICLDTPELTLPHPLFKQRHFVLQPLAEIYPELVIDNLSLSEHLQKIESRT